MNKKKKGFTIIEVLVSVGLVGIMALLMASFIFELNFSNAKTKADREALDNARRAMDAIMYEIKGAQDVYVPTTTSSQLSLKTLRYLPTGEDSTYMDFFLCGVAVCLKKESQNPVALTADTVEVSSLQFTRILNGSRPSVKISMTVNYKNPDNNPANAATVTLSQAVSLRSY